MEENNLTEIWRDINPTDHVYSWFRRKPLSASRIDFFLVNPGVAGHVKEVKYKYGCRSNHILVQMQLWDEDIVKGRGSFGNLM